VEAVLDFMFWPRRNIGWYVEPGYEITFRDGGQHRGVGVYPPDYSSGDETSTSQIYGRDDNPK
jgi:hypothetical protein